MSARSHEVHQLSVKRTLTVSFPIPVPPPTYTMLVSQEQAHLFVWARTCDKNDLAGEIWNIVHTPCWWRREGLLHDR